MAGGMPRHNKYCTGNMIAKNNTYLGQYLATVIRF